MIVEKDKRRGTVFWASFPVSPSPALSSFSVTPHVNLKTNNCQPVSLLLTYKVCAVSSWTHTTVGEIKKTDPHASSVELVLPKQDTNPGILQENGSNQTRTLVGNLLPENGQGSLWKCQEQFDQSHVWFEKCGLKHPLEKPVLVWSMTIP